MTEDLSEEFKPSTKMEEMAGFGDLYGTYWVVSKGDHNDAKFLINENGNVGIGTVGPLSKLHVAGTIMAGAGDSVTGVNAFSIPYANGSICNWGSLRSTGSSYMSYGVKASGTNAGWLSSSGDTSFVKQQLRLMMEVSDCLPLLLRK